MARKKRKKPRPNRTAFWLILFFLVGTLALAWWLRPHLFPSSPQFNFLLIERNGQSLKLIKGEVLHLKPQDRFRIRKISSNRLLSQGIRLFSKGFDVNAFGHDDPPVSDYLPSGDIFNRYDFRVEVVYRNQTLGHVNILIEPDLEDWLVKADRTIDKVRKIALLEKALTHKPGDPRLTGKLIEAYKSGKKWTQAAATLEKTAEKTPDLKVLSELLEIYETLSDRDGIISVLKRLIRLNPDEAALKIRLADLWQEAGNVGEAISAYEEALKDMGKEERGTVYKTLGYLYTRTDQPKKAIDCYLKALEGDQKDVNLYYNLADLYEKSGQQGKADGYLAKALKVKTGDVEGRLSLAERLIERGKLKQAEAYLDEVLKKNPSSLEALIFLMTIAEKRADKHALLGLYKKIHTLDPKNETVIYNLGTLEYEAGRLNKSAPYFKKYLTAHPKDKETHVFLFDIYKRLKKDDLAFEEAQALVSLDPKGTAPYYYMVEYLNARGDYKKMIEITKKGLKIHPEDMDLREYLILSYLKTDKEDSAFQEMRKSLRLRPKDVPMLLQFAQLQEKRGTVEGAVDTYQRILDVSPGHKKAKEATIRLLLRRAANLEEQDELEKALETYKKVLDLSPGQEEAEEAYLRLRLEELPGEAKRQ